MAGAQRRELLIFILKGWQPCFSTGGITDFQIKEAVNEENAIRHDIYYKNTLLGSMQNIRPKYLQRFDIKQPVFLWIWIFQQSLNYRIKM